MPAIWKAFKDVKERKELQVEALGSNMPSVRVFNLKQGSKRKEALVTDPLKITRSLR